MHRHYSDLLEGRPDPLWWNTDGVPRWLEFGDQALGVYWKGAVLFQIRCQSCRKKFRIGAEWSSYDNSWADVKLEPSYREDGTEISAERIQRLSVEQYAWVPKSHIVETGQYSFEEMVLGHCRMGDPPAHGCVGDTMNSVPTKIIKVISRGKWSAMNNSDKEHPEFVGRDIRPDWAKDERT